MCLFGLIGECSLRTTHQVFFPGPDDINRWRVGEWYKSRVVPKCTRWFVPPQKNNTCCKSVLHTILPLLCKTINYTGIIYTTFYGWTCTLSEKKVPHCIFYHWGSGHIDQAQFAFDKYFSNQQLSLDWAWNSTIVAVFWRSQLSTVASNSQCPSDTTRSNVVCFFSVSVSV